MRGSTLWGSAISLWVVVSLTYQYMALVSYWIFGSNQVVVAIYYLKDVGTIALFGIVFAHCLTQQAHLPRKVATLWIILFSYMALLAVDLFRVPLDLAFVKNLRQAMLLPAFAMIFLTVTRDHDVKTIFNIFLWVCILNITVCTLEFIFDEKYYQWTELRNFKDRTLIGYTNQSGSAGHFYSSDLAIFGFEKMVRLQGIFLEPTFNGFFCLVSLLLFSSRLSVVRAWLAAIGLFTFSKMFLIGGILLVGRRLIRGREKLLATLMFFLVVALGLLFRQDYSHGALSHARGLVSGLEIALNSMVGLGLGEAGNHNRYFNTSVVNGELGGESALGGLLAQLGLRSLIFIGFAMLYWRYLASGRVASRKAASDGKLLACMFLLALMASASSMSNTYQFLFALVSLLLARQTVAIDKNK